MGYEGTILTQRQSVLHLNTELPRGPELGLVFQAAEDLDDELDDTLTVFIPDRLWVEMGSPTVITATVRPGDHLNPD